MASLRRRLSLLAFVWMMFQAAGIAVPLLAMHVDGATVETLCTCDGDDHATCPMHHAVPPPPPDDGSRTLRSSCAPADTALLALFSAPGLLPAVTDSTPLDRALDAVSTPAPRPLSRVELPDAPPPRA